MRRLQMVNLLLAGILLPVIGIVLLWRRPRRPKGGWFATFFLALGLTAFSYFAVPWGYIGFPFRYTIAALFLAAVLISLRRPIDDRADDSPTRMLVKLLIALFFGNVALGVARAHSVPPNPLDLTFPLKGGPYAVVHAGSTPAANTYVGRGAQSFGVDVAKRGMEGEEVLAPCAGTVVAVKPLRLQCGDAIVELGGVQAVANAAVQRGAVLARMTAPQLHVHAERNGQAVPVTFDGRWLVRNDVVRPAVRE